MLYHLLTPLADTLPGANVFRYISFRTAWALITALVITYVVFPWFIERMKQLRMEQIIREDGPDSHRLTKLGTPTMGGVPLLTGIVVSTLLWSRLDDPLVWMVLIISVGCGLIGFADDWLKVNYRNAAGLPGRFKILGQLAIGGVVFGGGYLSGHVAPVVQLPFLKHAVVDFGAASAALAQVWPIEGWSPDLAWIFVAFAVFILVGTSNGVNLTDGLDGLAIGPVMTCAATYGMLAYLGGNVKFAEYLDILYVDGAGELMIFAVAIVGAGLGFLWYNAYPAQIFMGDVGSLALGGALAGLAVCTKQEILLALVGGIFVLESMSVIIQVASFKLTGKRVFEMAPIHHHYEKKGWSEPKIIVRFWIISVVLALVAMSTLKLR